MVLSTNKKMGWIPDVPDHRDKKYETYRLHLERITSLPKSVDLRPLLPKCFDQGGIGSCVSNATAAALMFDRAKQKLPKFMPSRLFIYYNAREMDGTLSEDAGTNIRTAVKVVATKGFAHESAWKYDETKFTIKPVDLVYEDAKKFYTTKYFKVDNTNISSLKNCLAAGYPIIIGFSVYENFYDADRNNGVVSLPNASKMLGGHSVLLVGYNDNTERFIIRNSWGTTCGDGTGHYYMQYEYLTNADLADDFWTIRSVSNDSIDKPLL